MLRQSRSTRSLEERLPASKAYDVLGSFVLFFVSLKDIHLLYSKIHTAFSCDVAVLLVSLALRSRLDAALAPCEPLISREKDYKCGESLTLPMVAVAAMYYRVWYFSWFLLLKEN